MAPGQRETRPGAFRSPAQSGPARRPWAGAGAGAGAEAGMRGGEGAPGFIYAQAENAPGSADEFLVGVACCSLQIRHIFYVSTVKANNQFPVFAGSQLKHDGKVILLLCVKRTVKPNLLA